MNQNIVYVGIDVDDVRYHGCGFDQRTGEALEFHCRPTLKGLVGQLEKLREYFGTVPLSLCYEASYVGFSLQRDLSGRGYDCAVVAPSSIPRRAGKSVKTDRIDAKDLAEFYANDLLTVVSAPDPQLEEARDLLRSGRCADTSSHCFGATACTTKPRRSARPTGKPITTAGWRKRSSGVRAA